MALLEWLMNHWRIVTRFFSLLLSVFSHSPSHNYGNMNIIWPFLRLFWSINIYFCVFFYMHKFGWCLDWIRGRRRGWRHAKRTNIKYKVEHKSANTLLITLLDPFHWRKCNSVEKWSVHYTYMQNTRRLPFSPCCQSSELLRHTYKSSQTYSTTAATAQKQMKKRSWKQNKKQQRWSVPKVLPIAHVRYDRVVFGRFVWFYYDDSREYESVLVTSAHWSLISIFTLIDKEKFGSKIRYCEVYTQTAPYYV